jgi:DNA repair exonuclease SbcCD ATPase subunit
MTGGFDTNVPARKPRTKLARVISELTSGAQDGTEGGEAPAVVDAPGPVTRDAVPDAGGNRKPDAAVAANNPAAAVTRPMTAPWQAVPTGTSPVSGGREQIARLRERLAAAAHPRAGAAEPKRTAAAVREMVDGLRERLEVSLRERSELAKALEEARAALARTGADLQKERRAREALEAQAEERRRIADDAVAEAEALAAERDQVLGELTELRRVEGEQTSLLMEVEAALTQRDAERASAARELAEARELVDLRAAEVADLEARLQDEAADRAGAERQCRELQAEIARLTEAQAALESIEATLGYRRENPGGDNR